MRHLLTFVLLTLSTAHAADDIYLVSYQDLMSMSEPRRDAYLREAADALGAFEERQAEEMLADLAASPHTRFIAHSFWLPFVREALAATDNPTAAVGTFGLGGGQEAPALDRNGKVIRRIVPKDPDFTPDANPAVIEGMDRNNNRVRIETDEGADVSVKTDGGLDYKTPAGGARGTTKIAPSGATAPPKAAAAAPAPSTVKPASAAPKPAAPAAGTVAPAPKARVALPSKRATQPYLGTPPPNDPNPLSLNPATLGRPPSTPKAVAEAKAAPTPPAKTAPAEAKPAEPKKNEPAKPAPPVKAGQCPRIKDRRAAREKWRSSHQGCFIAGSISSYPNPGQPGQCRADAKGCGKTNSFGDDGQLLTQPSAKTTRCQRAFYCTTSGKPVCVLGNKTALANCDAVVKAQKDVKFGAACAKGPNYHADYTELRRSIEAICGVDTDGLFCRDCAVMRAKLKAAAERNGVAGAAGAPGARPAAEPKGKADAAR